jgi:hypothetical protein
MALTLALVELAWLVFNGPTGVAEGCWRIPLLFINV